MLFHEKCKKPTLQNKISKVIHKKKYNTHKSLANNHIVIYTTLLNNTFPNLTTKKNCKNLFTLKHASTHLDPTEHHVAKSTILQP